MVGRLAGSLDVLTLPGLLQALSDQGTEGRLTITWGEQGKILHLGGGTLTLLEGSHRMGPRLGEILVRRGRISEAQLEPFLRMHDVTGRRLGTRLVQQGVISEGDLHDALGDQAAEEIFEVLGWPGAEFVFEQAPRPGEDARLGSQPITGLLLEASRRTDETKVIRRVLPSDSIRLVRTRTPIPWDHPNLDAEVVRALTPLLGGLGTIAELCAQLPYSRFRVLQALATMMTLGLARPEKTPTRRYTPAPPDRFVVLTSDLPSFLSQMSMGLRRAGFVVVPMPANSEFHLALKMVEPSAVVVDLGSASRDRLELVRQIRAHTDAPILGLAANAEPDAVVQAAKAGATELLVRPFSLEQLTERLERLIEGGAA